ncbi:hypothetical protein C8Q80DRAFT_1152256 [Daedaleopsis nitida]|nr:hypothetical protein C8Q80DRAFT_1152256 [Daedaleopsis nitida]
MDTPSKVIAPPHRLLYRGSLSLPDSHLLLDGLSFTVKLGETHGSPALLNNTLALTLESLRGLPLHLIGTVRVKDTWIEPPGDINIDIHPDSTLTRLYFENIFCLTPITSADSRTEYGVRVSLTDNNDPETPDLLIYGELRDAPPATTTTIPSTSTSPPKVLHLLAARIFPGPPPPHDPTPRKPPLAFGAKRKRDTSGVPFDLTDSKVESTKRAKTTDAKGKGRAHGADDALRRAAAETMLRMPKPQKTASSSATQVDLKALGKEARVGVKKGMDQDVFKVPNVPVRAGLGRSASEADVFGSLSGRPPESVDADAAVEKANKTFVKKEVMRRLAVEGIDKRHSEFKGIYQMCYQGTSFALRRRMAVAPLEGSTVEQFVDAHVRMYVTDAPP